DGRLLFYPSMFYPSSATVASASVVAVATGKEIAGINLDLKPVAVRRVTGRVTGPDGPAEGLVVRMVPADPAASRASVNVMNASQAMADSSGRFTFIGVPPGSYTLVAVRAATPVSNTTLWATDSVALGETDVSDVALTLRTGAAISGTIVVEGTAATPTPQQLRAITITARSIPGSAAALQPNPLSTAQSDEAG